jgi:hypothetical protein
VSKGPYNFSDERSFSKFKRIKNELRSTIRQDCLYHLMLMSLELEVLRDIELTELSEKVTKIKARKMSLPSVLSSTRVFKSAVTLSPGACTVCASTA